MDVSANLALFQELLRCGEEIDLWQYDGDGNLLASNCSEKDIFNTAFSVFGCRERMLRHGSENKRPMIFSASVGLIWGADFVQKENYLEYCYVLGPVFYSGISAAYIRRTFLQADMPECDTNWREQFVKALPYVPATNHMAFTRNLLMLHYCLTGERIGAGELLNVHLEHIPKRLSGQERDRHKVWSAEQALLQMVRDGNPDYQDAFNRSSLLSNGVPLKSNMPMRQMKTSVIVFCSLVCRAAIEGGLSPDKAYSLSDAYIQEAEDANTLDELSAIAGTMYSDFIRQVHQLRENPAYSRYIQRCCDYIETHLDRNIHAKDLTKLVGYSTTYLTRQFRKETGVSLSDYVKYARVERAKLLLSTTDLNIQAIADELGFTTRSYFSQCFHQVVGQTPKEYRENTAWKRS